MATKYVYFFGAGRADGKGTMKDLLGGKGAGLAEMTNAGVPVPPGFTITTDVCRYYYANKQKLPKELPSQQSAALEKLQKILNKRFGNAGNPLLVSVRSGAKFSMPGMMDTILNLGINDHVVESLTKLTNNPRFAWDAYRRAAKGRFGQATKDAQEKLWLQDPSFTRFCPLGREILHARHD